MELLADPNFKRVPSMQPQQKKTAIAFHAKDDLPEVRSEVFKLLMRYEMRFQAVVRDKQAVLSYVRQRNEHDPTYRYQQNELYDALVSRLFKNLLHKANAYRVCFARRGSSDRTAAFGAALEQARRNFNLTWNKIGTAPVEVLSGWPAQHTALQAVDYFLWALQRLYERQEERYLDLIWPKGSLVYDVDDTRQKKYGVYYDTGRCWRESAPHRNDAEPRNPSRYRGRPSHQGSSDRKHGHQQFCFARSGGHCRGQSLRAWPVGRRRYGSEQGPGPDAHHP